MRKLFCFYSRHQLIHPPRCHLLQILSGSIVLQGLMMLLSYLAMDINVRHLDPFCVLATLSASSVWCSMLKSDDRPLFDLSP